MRTTVISRPPTRDEAKAEIDRHLREATYWLAGEFFEAFYSKAWLYNGITISAFDTPNLQGNGRVVPGLITQLDVEETAQEYGEESPMYMAKVRAEFPDSLSDAIVSRSDIMAAVERDLTPEATEHIFAKWTVKPRLERLKLALNQRLLKLFPERGLHFDFEDPTPANRELDMREAVEGYQVGIHTLNESRALMGLDELPGGDVVFQATSSGGTFSLGVLPRKAGVPALKAPDPLDLAERLMDMAWKRRLAAEAEGLADYLEELNPNTLAVRHLAIAHLHMQGKDWSHLQQKLEVGDTEAYDWDWWTKYKSEVIQELTAAFRASIDLEWPLIEPSLADLRAVEYAEVRGARLLRLDGDLNLVTATRHKVNQLVAGTIERGESLQTLQKALRDDFTFSLERARVVARTEAATAQGEGAKAAALAQDFNEKRLIRAPA